MPELDKKSSVCPDCLACGFPFWEQLTPEEQEFLCRTTRPVKYKIGERVHSPVENCVGILLLRTGQLRAYLLSEDGRDVTLYRLFPGEVCILSASCVMDSVNFDLYIDAEEDTEAYCIGAGTFRRLMQQNVHVRCFAYQMTAERFSDTMWTMQQILFMSADRRLAIFLTDELAKTGGSNVRMTHDQMARYMGSARGNISRRRAGCASTAAAWRCWISRSCRRLREGNNINKNEPFTSTAVNGSFSHFATVIRTLAAACPAGCSVSRSYAVNSAVAV